MDNEEKLEPPKYPARSTAENYDFFNFGEGNVDMYFLRNIVTEQQPEIVPINSLVGQIEEQKWAVEPDNKVHPEDVLTEFRRLNNDIESVKKEHPDWSGRLERILRSNYSYPILIYKGFIVDGLHRTLHAIFDGKTEISAHIVNELPPEGFISDNLLKGIKQKG